MSHVINVDLAKVYTRDSGGSFDYLTTLAWGDPIELREATDDFVRVTARAFSSEPDGSVVTHEVDGFLKPPESSNLTPSDCIAEAGDVRILKVAFVDVQQGDGSVVETPDGKVILIDGGDNQLFARYLATQYPGTTIDNPKKIDCIVVTHGDADHFAGLPEILESEQQTKVHKRLFIAPQRIYHNGLVKRPETIAGRRLREVELFGTTAPLGDDLVITDLVDDLLAVPTDQMNTPFRKWRATLDAYRSRGNVQEMRRLEAGDDAFDDFIDADVDVRVLGPLVTEGESVRGLKFLGRPRPNARFEELPPDTSVFSGNSASHTINGHSIVLKITFGRARFLFAGDLNEQSEETLTSLHNDGRISLRAEVFKAPHHGSADFSIPFIKAVAPVISVISSGDEDERREYIHPRATLVGALGRWGRAGVAEPLVFATEMVAFFKTEGFVTPEFHRLVDGDAVIENGEVAKDDAARPTFFAFSRAAFGIVKVRTDGQRLLVWTNSGQTDLKEAYAYDLSGATPRPVPLRRA